MNRFRNIEDKTKQIRLLAGLGIDYYKDFEYLKTSSSEVVDKKTKLDHDVNVHDEEITLFDKHQTHDTQNEKKNLMAADLDELNRQEEIDDNETSDWKIGDDCWAQVVDKTWVNCRILDINGDQVCVEFACPPYRQYCGLDSLKNIIPITAISD